MTTVLTLMLDAQTFTAFLSTVSASLGAISASLIALFEIYSLNKKLKAEAKLRKILLSQWKAFILQRKHKEIQNSYMMNFDAAWTDSEAARNEIENALKQLPESDRQAILEGLRQPSEIGRGEYIKKLLGQVVAHQSARLSPDSQ